VSGVSPVRAAAARGDLAEVERLVAKDGRAVRTLVALTYEADAATCEAAAAGLALAARHHPRLVAEAVRRLIWAMNDESGTYAVNAPAVIGMLAESEPKILVPVLPDLLRLTADPGLRERLVAAVKRVAERCPADAAHAVSAGLGRCARGESRREQ
jgi:hypothetical protein